jgi:hypothetical protein
MNWLDAEEQAAKFPTERERWAEQLEEIKTGALLLASEMEATLDETTDGALAERYYLLQNLVEAAALALSGAQDYLARHLKEER